LAVSDRPLFNLQSDWDREVPRYVVLKAALEMGHSEDEAIQFFAGLDLDGNGVIDLDELTIAYNRMVPKTSYEEATVWERILAIFMRPKVETGKWYPKEGSGADVNEPYGRHFNKFTHYHTK
jgi:hypothetical protein